MTLSEVIQDIHALNVELQTFEKKYGVLSEDFFKLYEAGRLRDEEPAEIIDYGRWAAFYQTKVHWLEVYAELFDEKMRSASESEMEEGVVLTSPVLLAEV